MGTVTEACKKETGTVWASGIALKRIWEMLQEAYEAFSYGLENHMGSADGKLIRPSYKRMRIRKEAIQKSQTLTMRAMTIRMVSGVPIQLSIVSQSALAVACI